MTLLLLPTYFSSLLMYMCTSMESMCTCVHQCYFRFILSILTDSIKNRHSTNYSKNNTYHYSILQVLFFLVVSHNSVCFSRQFVFVSYFFISSDISFFMSFSKYLAIRNPPIKSQTVPKTLNMFILIFQSSSCYKPTVR